LGGSVPAFMWRRGAAARAGFAGVGYLATHLPL